MLFFLTLLLACMHLNISSYDIGSTNIPFSIENALPTFLTPSYYRQRINDGCNWAEQNKKEIFATAAIASLARFTFGKVSCGLVLGVGGIYFVYFKPKIDKIERDQINQNKDQQRKNEEFAEKLAGLGNQVQRIIYTSKSTEQQLQRYGLRLQQIEDNLSNLGKKIDSTQTSITESSDIISSIKSEIPQIKENISQANSILAQFVQEHKKQDEQLKVLFQSIDLHRKETRVITTASTNHIMTETKKLVQNHSYSPAPFDANQYGISPSFNSGLMGGMRAGSFKPSFKAQS